MRRLLLPFLAACLAHAYTTSAATGGGGSCAPVVLVYTNEAAQPVRLRASVRVDGYLPGTAVEVLPETQLATRETLRVEGKACVPVGSVLTHSAEVVGVRAAWNPSVARAAATSGGALVCRLTVYGGGAAFSVRHACTPE